MATCKDCLHLPVCNNVYFNLDILRQRYCGMYLPFGKQPSWIPVSERLPEKDGRFLVYKQIFNSMWVDVLSFAKDGRKVCEYDFAEQWKNVWYFYDSEYGHIVCNSVTHWMPMPEPPQEVSNGQT